MSTFLGPREENPDSGSLHKAFDGLSLVQGRPGSAAEVCVRKEEERRPPRRHVLKSRESRNCLPER